MPNILSLPSTITAGDSLEWSVDLPAYPTNDGWALSYTLINATGSITISAVADGDRHLFLISADESAAYTPGRYDYAAFVSKDGMRHTIERGSTRILPDLAAMDHYDMRSHARRCLDNIEAVIEDKASSDVLQYSIDGKSLSRYSHAELLALRNKYKAMVEQEERKAAGKRSNMVKVRFAHVS